MTIKLTGTDTNGVGTTADGEAWITLQGELVANAGVAFIYFHHNDISYTLSGTVLSSSNIAIEGRPTPVGALAERGRVLITETGLAQGATDGVYLAGAESRITNEGTAIGEAGAGLEILNRNGQINNYGLAQGGEAGIIINSTTGMVNNHGQAVSADLTGQGIKASGTGIRVDNFALARGGTGIEIIGANAVLRNDGQAIGQAGNGVTASGGALDIQNSGLIDGMTDGLFATVDGISSRIVNTGQIIAGDDGIEIDSSAGESVTIVNSGQIRSNGASTVDHAIEGDIGTEIIQNTGQIIGSLNLFQGNDTLVFGAGSSVEGTYDGGDDADTLDMSPFGAAIWADLGFAGTEIWTKNANDLTTGNWGAVLDLANVENIVGTVGIDLMRGDGQDNSFGYVGNSLITGIEEITGRGGTDTADFARFGSAVWVDLAFSGGDAWTRDGAGVSTGNWRQIADLDSIENITGTALSDELFGDAGANVLNGGDGDGASDKLTGRAGLDTFVFPNAFGTDTITDFDADNGEKIDLSDVNAIVDFTDLTTSHLTTGTGGAAQIFVGASTITLTGWTVGDFGVGNSISADDFVF